MQQVKRNNLCYIPLQNPAQDIAEPLIPEEKSKNVHGLLCLLYWLLPFFEPTDVVLLGKNKKRVAIVTNTQSTRGEHDVAKLLKEQLLSKFHSMNHKDQERVINLIWLTFTGAACKEMKGCSYNKRLSYYLTELENREPMFFDFEIAGTLLGGDFVREFSTGKCQELGIRIETK